MGKIDSFFNKWISRKLATWIMATILLWFGKLDGQSWMFITIIYLVVQGVIDAKSAIETYLKK